MRKQKQELHHQRRPQRETKRPEKTQAMKSRERERERERERVDEAPTPVQKTG